MNTRELSVYTKSVRAADSRGTHPPLRLPRARIGRNARCPCGSGVKFKRCLPKHLAAEAAKKDHES